MQAAKILRELRASGLIHQLHYHMFERRIEQGLGRVLLAEGLGGIAFCPLAQGLLTNRYLAGIPADARAERDPRFLKSEHITEDKLTRLRRLNVLAQTRGQSLAQLALAWVLRNPPITSALIWRQPGAPDRGEPRDPAKPRIQSDGTCRHRPDFEWIAEPAFPGWFPLYTRRRSPTPEPRSAGRAPDREAGIAATGGWQRARRRAGIFPVALLPCRGSDRSRPKNRFPRIDKKPANGAKREKAAHHIKWGVPIGESGHQKRDQQW